MWSTYIIYQYSTHFAPHVYAIVTYLAYVIENNQVMLQAFQEKLLKLDFY